MSLKGDAHPQSNSSWGHEYDFKSRFVSQTTRLATAEAIDPSGYEPVEPGETRFYLVAVKLGQTEVDGPAPSFPRAVATWVNEDSTFGIEAFYDAVRSGHDWYLEDGQELPDAISEPLETAGPIPEAHRPDWQDVLQDAHDIDMSTESQQQAGLDEFQTADEIDESDEKPNWQPQAEGETDTGTSTICRSCDNRVSRDFARVFGDNDDVVHGCPKCCTYRELGGRDFVGGGSA